MGAGASNYGDAVRSDFTGDTGQKSQNNQKKNPVAKERA